MAKKKNFVEKALDILGYVAKDKITGFEGVVESLAFDLYGCVQVALKPTTTKEDGTIKDGMWFDINRLEVSKERRMVPKDFFSMPVEEATDWDHGPADKSTMRKA